MPASSYKHAAESSRELAAEFFGQPERLMLLRIAETYDALSSKSATAPQCSGLCEEGQDSHIAHHRTFARR